MPGGTRTLRNLVELGGPNSANFVELSNFRTFYSPRNCSASPRCSAPIASDRSRSAIVRATRRTRSWPRAVSDNRVNAASNIRRASASSAVRARSSRPWSRAFSTSVPAHLSIARRDHAHPHRGRRLAARGRAELPRPYGAHRDRQIHPVAQRSRQPRSVPRDLHRRASARPRVVAVKPARARVHRANQHEPRRE